MDNMDDSENNAKISDSAYSNSCSNSQSRRSHSSKSTHSGSHSSGSSGYGGKLSTSGSSNNLSQPQKKEKESKKKKLTQVETLKADAKTDVECRSPEPTTAFDPPMEETRDVVLAPSPAHTQAEKGSENMEISSSDRNSMKDEVCFVSSPNGIVSCKTPLLTATVNFATSRPASSNYADGFSCVISMHDGVVMYTTPSLHTTLGFPKDMWIGRSFIDFLHPKDRNTFASQITSGLAIPKFVNGTQDKAPLAGNPGSKMVCRIRRYRGLSSGFSVKDRVVTFMPFLLKFTFKNINDDNGEVIYLVIQASPFFSAFKVQNEIVTKALPFVIRHDANGNLEYIDPESVPYLGYLPQDLTDKDALQLYHPDDLGYLQQVYETIVKKGSSQRSKAFRMITQNGDYIKVETEWSSFINPWSRKLEFVIGKHHIIEGPSNPNVFQSPDPDKGLKLNEEQKNNVNVLRENIIRIMNEVLTKPAEVAKQQMSKRCHDLTSFMESLLEVQPKDELHLEIQDADHSYYEHDSVMLGGISPHHDYNDSKSSTETPLSYNQLNYNETLQRYFKSHQPYSYEDCNIVNGDNILGLIYPKLVKSTSPSPMAQNSGDSGELVSSCESSALVVSGNSPVAPLDKDVRLTESMLNKHNAEMEKELIKMHRENRSSTKVEREKVTNETRQKKKEHLARCHATFQPTTARAIVAETQPHGVKRAKPIDSEAGAQKHHCPSPRQSRHRHAPSVAPAQPSTITTTLATQWPMNPANNMNTFYLGVGIPQQMPIMSPVTAVSGMFPMYYAPVTASPIPPVTSTCTTTTQFHTPAMQCMMYGQPMYGSPFMYSPISQQVPYPMQQTAMAQNLSYPDANSPLGLTTSNYEQACNTIRAQPPKTSGSHRLKKRAELLARKIDQDHARADSNGSTSAFYRSTEVVTGNKPPQDIKTKNKLTNSEETVDRTDGESSYSSFYSSFFKTESGSAEDSSDAKKAITKDKNGATSSNGVATACQGPLQATKIARRKMEPPWMEQVCVTSELVYKYQILTKTADEVLNADKEKMNEYQQPSMVNEQLGQLYLDLQLEGVAARLTLEEGITSSSSSGEENSTNGTMSARVKREYSKVVMIYEENAPLPPPPENENELPKSSPSMS